MSKFLGPIHNVLFDKIKYLEYIEEKMITECKKELGDQIDSIIKEAYLKFGEPVSNKQIEDVIDTNNIHGSFQKLVNNTESRHSYLLRNLQDKYSNKAFKLIKKAYHDCGVEAAALITESYDNCTAEDLYSLVNNYILDGMPSDSINAITKSDDDYVTWQILNRIHNSNFENGVKTYYELRKVLVNEVISKLNNTFTYSYEIKTSGENEYFTQSIRKTS